MYIMVQYTHTAISYPKHLPKVNMGNKPRYDMDELMNIPYYHKEGVAEVGLRSQHHRMLCIYHCYEMNMPPYMMCDEMRHPFCKQPF